jgi:Fe-S oxidoreductase
MHVGVCKAGVTVLEALDFRVDLPDEVVCCGRPLYDYGMLDTAKHVFKQSLTAMRPFVAAGIPIVGLEPSCVAAFRDELRDLFPEDEDARRFSANF